MIVIDKLSKTYRTENIVSQILQDVSIVIPTNSIVAITGTSGVGKSTFLRTLCGLDVPDEGRILFDAEELTNRSYKQRAIFRLEKCGFVFQDYRLISTLDVRDNIILPTIEKNKKVHEEWYRKVIEITDLVKKEDMYPEKLSGGECQRVAIARAIINKPLYLFADEPTGNLDQNNTERVMNFLTAYAMENECTLIYVTHDNNLCKYADIVFEIRDKKLFERVVG